MELDWEESSRAKERKMSYGARGTKGLAQEKGQLQVCLLHTHWLPLPSSLARPKTAREDVDPAYAYATHSDTIFLNQTHKLWLNIWLF